MTESKSYFVYIIRTENNKLYIGQTNSLKRREHEHKNFYHGAQFLNDNATEFKVVYSEEYDNRTEAMNREKQLKGWTRAKKEALIKGDINLLKKL